MPATRDDFQRWLFDMDDSLEELFAYLPADVALAMDYTIDSLEAIEKWLLSKYETHQQVKGDAEVLDMLSRYVGETIRKVCGGSWDIEQTNEKNAFYRIPVIKKPGAFAECPVTLVTASLDRRRGDYSAKVVRAMLKRFGPGTSEVP